MDIVDQLDHDDLEGSQPTGGASSTEDFWMFFSFAMIMLVFVLMNYVNYLNSLVVKAPEQEQEAEPKTAEVTPAAPSEDVELHVLVTPSPTGVGGATYRFSDDPKATAYRGSDLQRVLAEQLREVGDDKPVKVFVHAPGTVLYQSVFDASYAAWQVGESHPEHPLDVHLVYEEQQ